MNRIEELILEKKLSLDIETMYYKLAGLTLC